MKQIKFIVMFVWMGFISAGVIAQISPNAAIRELEKKKEDNSIYHLSDLQKKQIKDIKNSEKKDLLALYNQMRSKKAQLKSYETSDTIEMSKINILISEIGTLYVKIYKSKAEHRQLIRNLLTAEQRLDYDIRYSTGRENIRKNKVRETCSDIKQMPMAGNMPVIYIVNQDMQARPGMPGNMFGGMPMQTARQEPPRLAELPSKPLKAVTSYVPVLEEAEEDISSIEEIEVEADE